MSRFLMSFALVLAFSAASSASLHSFDATPAPGEANVITILGSSIFELTTSPNGFQFPVGSPGLDISVEAAPVDGGTLTFNLVRGSTLDGSANLVFNEQGGSRQLFVSFFDPSIMMGDAFPDVAVGGTTSGSWRAPGIMAPTGAPNLGGALAGGISTVPEPSAFALGGLVIGLVAGGRYVRRRFLGAADVAA